MDCEALNCDDAQVERILPLGRRGERMMRHFEKSGCPGWDFILFPFDHKQFLPLP